MSNTSKHSYILLIILSFFVSCNFANALLIDEFDGEQLTRSSGTQLVSYSVLTSLPVLGTTRAFRTEILQGPSRMELETNVGKLFHSQNSDVAGISLVSWDGNSDPGTLDPTGLGGIDFIQDNATGIEIYVSSYDPGINNQPTSLVLSLYDANDPSGQTFSRAVLDLAQPMLNVNLTVPFTNFTITGPTGAVDLRNIGAVSLQIEGRDYGVDLTLDRIRTNGTCAITPNSLGRVIDDCGVCGGNNELMDVCGLCGGDGKSCLDCNGTPFGTAALDKCNVCGGNGTSCRNCEVTDMTTTLAKMDGGAKTLEKLIKSVIRRYRKSIVDEATLQQLDSVLTNVHELQIRNWILSWTLPRYANTCDDLTLCYSASNTTILDEYRSHNTELRDILFDYIKIARKEKLSNLPRKLLKRFRRKGDRVSKTNVELSNSVPLEQHVCSE